MKSLALAVLGLAAAAGSLVHAETILVDDKVELRDTAVARPSRGISMKSVESQFGAPASRRAAVGKPPITRWDYPGFSVFFEYDHVVHAVATAP
jgi:hypothetical protein